MPPATQMSKRERFSTEKKIKALDSYAEYGLKNKAARAASVNRRTLDRHLAEDPDFAEAWAVAKEACVESMEEELQNRAKNGTLVTKYDRSGTVQSETYQKSDALMLAWLRAHKPDTYSERKQITTSSTVHHEHTLQIDTSKLDPAQQDAIRALLGPSTQAPKAPSTQGPQITVEPTPEDTGP